MENTYVMKIFDLKASEISDKKVLDILYSKLEPGTINHKGGCVTIITDDIEKTLIDLKKYLKDTYLYEHIKDIEYRKDDFNEFEKETDSATVEIQIFTTPYILYDLKDHMEKYHAFHNIIFGSTTPFNRNDLIIERVSFDPGIVRIFRVKEICGKRLCTHNKVLKDIQPIEDKIPRSHLQDVLPYKSLSSYTANDSFVSDVYKKYYNTYTDNIDLIDFGPTIDEIQFLINQEISNLKPYLYIKLDATVESKIEKLYLLKLIDRYTKQLTLSKIISLTLEDYTEEIDLNKIAAKDFNSGFNKYFNDILDVLIKFNNEEILEIKF